MSRVIWPSKPNSLPARAPVRLVMAGGGTGGHLYPGLAVAEALREELEIDLLWAATPRPVDERLLAGFGDRYIRQSVQPLVKDLRKVWGFWKGWQNSCRYWKEVFETQSVDGVLALGGYAAGPAAWVASRRGLPVGLLNPDAVPGLANRFLLKHADRVFTQWAFPEPLARKVKGEVMALGCPIRRSLLGRTREEGAAKLGLSPKLHTLVITGASLGARTINDAILMLLHEPLFRGAFLRPEAAQAGLTPGSWQILHLTGMDQAAEVQAAYGPFLSTIQAQVLDYCDDMASVWAVADLAIARAGASTCAELTACGVPAILMPYPFHRDQHQFCNAQALVDAGAALIVEDRKESRANAAALKPELQALLGNLELRDQMAQAARTVGKPLAAQEIAREMLRLIDARRAAAG